MSDVGEAVAHTAHAGGNALTRKLGPLPAWVWGAGAIGGYVLYRRLRPAAPAVAVDPSMDPSSVGSSATAAPAMAYDPATGAVYDAATGSFSNASVPGVSNAYGLATNGQWSDTAANGLISAGQDASTVANAITTYLAGGQLSPSQVAAVQSAISTYGVPPGGVLPINAAPVTITAPAPVATPAPSSSTPAPSHAPTPAPKPVAKPAPKPVAKKPAPKSKAPSQSYSSYKIHAGDTLTSIAKKYYGHATSAEINAIAKASGISNPNLIIAGHTLRIPHNV